MKLQDLKYILAFLLPCTLLYSIFTSSLPWLTPIVAFVVIPLTEQLLPPNTTNESPESNAKRSHVLFFDFLLYLNLPLVTFILYAFIQHLQRNNLSIFQTIGLTLSLGIVMAVNGINVAHELGHRSDRFSQWVAKILLTYSLYNHFTIEHNRGHHVHVATKEDYSTARKNEWLYTFWFRSIGGVYGHAWKLEAERLKRIESHNLFENEMIINTVLLVFYATLMLFTIPLHISLALISAAIISILMLESINYVEHYGLERQKNENGQYELIQPKHSWNSDHQIGRIVLYELTRHSDHHYKASKKYQTLQHYDTVPQLPNGYPSSILLAMIPPIWFRKINKLIPTKQ